MRISGLFLVAVALLLPIPLYFQHVAEHGAVTMISLYAGAAALVAMGVIQLLSTRMRGLESLFGGMDRIYQLHKWLGILSMALMVLHDELETEVRGRQTMLNDFGDTLGEWSYYGFWVLLLMSLATVIPYNLWRYTHKVMGAVYALAALHFLLVLKPFALTAPESLYVAVFCLLGVLCYLYTLFPSLHRRNGYEIAQLTETGGSLQIDLRPTGNGITHRAGQFAFVTFDGEAEPHPFSLSAMPNETRTLRLTVRALGDFTRELPYMLSVGRTVHVEGPYGRFLRPRGQQTQIWIAGGIGITPFIAWAQGMTAEDTPAHLFYAVTDRERAAHVEELEALAETLPNLTLHLCQSSEGERVSAKMIVERVGVSLNACRAAFCGPQAMRDALRRDLVGLGLPKRRFQFENYHIRDDAGLGGLLRRLYGMIAKHVSLLPGEDRVRAALAELRS